VRKIAVVEDNPDNRLLVRVMLESLYEVIEFEDGPSALDALGREKPDLLLLDISLPEMDGMEVLRRIRANPDLGYIPVIALTAHAMTGDREKYLSLGFDDYVTKPIVDEAALLEAIKRKLPDGQATPAAEAKPPAVPEADAIDRLRRLGGDSFVADMIGLFLDYAAQKIAEGQRAQAAGDLPALQNAMHPIKSSAGNVGAIGVQALAAQIEDLAKQGQGEAVGLLLTELVQTFQELKPRFEDIQKSCSKP
jgi:CheY-like chemotaxis protein/HPt (histidine-containing phosphotransfer) domain-containing protein